MKRLSTTSYFLLISIFITAMNVCQVPLRAQVLTQFLPAVNGQSLNGLFTAQVFNNGAGIYTGVMRIRVKDERGKVIMASIIPSLELQRGMNLLLSAAQRANFQFASSASATIISQTNRFPPGDYEYCFEFTGKPAKPGADMQVFENCFSYTVPPAFALSLVYPYQQEEICNTRPPFNWQAAVPVSATCQYRFVLVSLKERQALRDAIDYNPPLVIKTGITGTMLSFPPETPALEKGQRYAWQVFSYQDNVHTSSSEIWPFKIGCGDPPPDTSLDSYRQLSTTLNGNYYVAHDVLRFSLLNPYGTTNARYSITDLSDPTRPIQHLPVLQVETGFHKIDLPLNGISDLQPNRNYLLKLYNIGDHPLYLQFYYTNA